MLEKVSFLTKKKKKKKKEKKKRKKKKKTRGKDAWNKSKKELPLFCVIVHTNKKQ